jgi:hypothetical protein
MPTNLLDLCHQIIAAGEKAKREYGTEWRESVVYRSVAAMFADELAKRLLEIAELIPRDLPENAVWLRQIKAILERPL